MPLAPDFLMVRLICLAEGYSADNVEAVQMYYCSGNLQKGVFFFLKDIWPEHPGFLMAIVNGTKLFLMVFRKKIVAQRLAGTGYFAYRTLQNT
jgi:hypothetical protein